MQASTPAFAAAVVSASQTTEFTVTLDLPQAGAYNDVSLAVESFDVDAQTVTDMPDGTRLITGYPSRQATITLSGLVDQTNAKKTIAWLMNPYQADSPMYRYDPLNQTVTIQAGLYLAGKALPELITIFTGQMDDYIVDMKAGTVTIIALDWRTKLTGSPMCPAAFDDGTTASLGPLFSVFAIEQMIRPAILSRPNYRTGCIFAAGLRQGMAADTGYGSQLSYAAPLVFGGTWRPATNPPQAVTALPDGTPYYTAGSNNAPAAVGVGTYATQGVGVAVNAPCFLECWTTVAQGRFTLVGSTVRQSGSVGIWDSTAGQNGVRVRLATSGVTDTVFVDFYTGGVVTSLSTALAAPMVSDGTSSYLAAQVTWTGTSGAATVRYRGQTYNLSGTVGSRTAVAWDTVVANQIPITYGGFGGNQYSAVDSVQVTTESAGSSSWNDTFVSGVDMDLSLNALTIVPDLTGSDIWTNIQLAAEAEQAVAGFNELGIFTFTNRATIAAAASARSITPTYSLKTFQTENGNSSVRNHIQIPVNAVQVQPFSVVWQSPEAIYVGPGGTYTATVSTAGPITGLATTCGLIPGGGLVSTSGYRASRNPNATVAVTNLTMTVAQTGPAQVYVTVSNPNGFGVWLISPTGVGYPAASDGVPAVAVGGHLVVAATVTDTTSITAGQSIADWQWPPAIEGGAVTNPRGELLLAPTSNPWVQSSGLASDLAQTLGEDLYQPKPLWRNVTIVADPRLQLVDRVTVTDPDTTGVNDDARIFGSKLVASKTDWTMALDLRAVNTPGGWLIGQAGRSEIGATTYV